MHKIRELEDLNFVLEVEIGKIEKDVSRISKYEIVRRLEMLKELTREERWEHGKSYWKSRN